MKISQWIVVVATLLGLSFAAPDITPSTNSYLTDDDKNRLQKVLEPGFKLSDVQSTYYAVLGYKLLAKAIPNSAEICKYLAKNAGNDADMSPETIFYIVSTWQSIGSCQSLPVSSLSKILAAVIEKDTSTIPDLYHAVSAYVSLSQKLSESTISKLVKLLQAALKKDDNLLNLGYIYHIAAVLGPAGDFALDKIEDTIVQADEVNGRSLQFEGGLSVTSLLVTGIAKLSTSRQKPPSVTSEQIVKITNYLLSRHLVQSIKGAAMLLSALKTLANNEFSKPICITLAEEKNAISVKQPFVNIKVCDIFGNALPTAPTVVANSATRLDDDVVVISKQSFKPSPKDKTIFSMNFMDIKPHRGFYKVAVLAGSVSTTVTVKVLSEVKLDYLEIGTGDADQTTQSKLVKIDYPKKLDHKIEADSQQKLVMKFSLRDIADNKSMRVHQAFVRLSKLIKSVEEKQLHEVIFVAEPDASNIYKFEMPVGSEAQTFGYYSGEYEVDLIVGDAVLSNSFQWHIATVDLKFPEQTGNEVNINKFIGYSKNSELFTPKSEIKHMFREPEKRPPVFMSNVFTGLCLAPILLLFILWVMLDVNISKFPYSLSAIIFHFGLGGIFVLFGIFWLRLNMFVTLRYLLGLGVVTFLAGSKLLSHIAHNQKVSR
ncbi:dolichyl-diphosphooligosaccharide--protein glycosyltransferase subunit 2 [Microplitis demolitor]|uniref:dolichyl-diphosphooligosaccharide--protein glycosyltransferase subunit 2 n=1 Tax=Microplitis demolitor TaxID=69319 RepID=UPI0004CD63DD|nr:dolichyl-diphosphooligosaccharide--protein glycosyltransferase subunit 2 [Microplitis demolitor]